MAMPPGSNNLPRCRVYANGMREWRLNRRRHREDRPAIEHPDGLRVWYLHGKCHREDGPAVEHAKSGCEWWIRGERHREDGPAVEHPDGKRQWWVRGRQIPWSLPGMLFALPNARMILGALQDPAAQREDALKWVERLSPDVWQRICADALADPYDPELRAWGIRALARLPSPAPEGVQRAHADVPHQEAR